MELDTTGWSGEGAFTATLLDHLKEFPSIAFVRIEDAPATRAEGNYSFISNEIYVRFRTEPASERGRWLGLLPVRRTVARPVMTLQDLEGQLATLEAVGPPDYADEAMLQYLKTERIVPPYQTRGYKVVELIRIYGLAV